MAPAIPFVMLAMTVATTAMGAMGSMAAGQAQQEAYKYNAAMALQSGTAEAAQKEQDTRRKLAEARAAYGAAGVDIQGTPLEVMSDMATQGELDRQTILWKARTEATQQNWLGQQAASEGKSQAIGTILSGLGKAGGQAMGMMGSGAGTSPLSTYTYPSATAAAHY